MANVKVLYQFAQLFVVTALNHAVPELAWGIVKSLPPHHGLEASLFLTRTCTTEIPEGPLSPAVPTMAAVLLTNVSVEIRTPSAGLVTTAVGPLLSNVNVELIIALVLFA
jgi:hypothetical protein